MANIRAFQACDESSILSARTKEKGYPKRYPFSLVTGLGGLNSHHERAKRADEQFENKEQGRKVHFF